MSTRNDYQSRLIEEFRANGGTVGGPFAHTPLLVLTTTGARSGQPHATLLGYLRDGERLMVIAAKQGASRHPDWYHNLVKHPQVTVEIGTEAFDASAALVEASERDRLWRKAVACSPMLAEQQAKTDRQFPVLALCRRAG